MSNSLSSRIVVETRPVFSGDGQFDGTSLAPFRIRPGMTVAEIKRDLYEVERSCLKADKRDVAIEVGKLTARTKMRVQGEGEARFLAETLIADLGTYPIDVVRFACEYWVDGGKEAKFLPSWPELKEICDRRMSGRLRLVRALDYALRVAA